MNQIFTQNKTSRAIPESIAKKAIEESLEILKVDNKYVEIIFVKEEEIKTLNKEHRQIDKSTDVLSFPQAEVSNIPNQILGSIVVSMEVAEKKGEQLSDVVKHGLLHLLGFDHEVAGSKWQDAANRIKCNL